MVVTVNCTTHASRWCVNMAESAWGACVVALLATRGSCVRWPCLAMARGSHVSMAECVSMMRTTWRCVSAPSVTSVSTARGEWHLEMIEREMNGYAYTVACPPLRYRFKWA